MKISYCSDIHLEFGDLFITNEDNADVLVLAGDIILAGMLSDKESNSRESIKYHNFFEKCCSEFKDVIYITGNHESYHFDITETYNHLKNCLGYLSNLHIMENEKIIIDGVTFLCATMWTNMNNGCPETMQSIGNRMNDFHIIENGNSKDKPLYDNRKNIFTPKDAYDLHIQTMNYFNSELEKEENETVVMVTHHNPSKECVPKKYQGDLRMNPGYVSDLSEFILNNPKIKAWICGHSHNRMECTIGECTIVQNCRGYAGRERMANTFELKTFNIPT